LQDISVTVTSSSGSGSGVIVVTKDGQAWVLTAGHVVAGLRSTRSILKDGSVRTLTEFKDASVLKMDIDPEEGRTTARHEYFAAVVKYSDADFGDDLALLKIRHKNKNLFNASARFYLDKILPPLGSELLHCGSLLGESGSNSLTSGILSQHGRLYQEKLYDQTSVAAFPGSSGGPVCLAADGRYVGMVVRGAGETYNLIVPIRRIRAWAQRAGVEFVIDPGKPVPSAEELRKSGLEENGVAGPELIGKPRETGQPRLQDYFLRKPFAGLFPAMPLLGH
jgi:S1-C subfamily serine protease